MCDSVEVLWSQSTSGRGGDGECVTVWRCCGTLRLSHSLTGCSLPLSLSLSSLPQALFVHIDSSEEQSDRIMDFFNLEKDDASCL